MEREYHLLTTIEEFRSSGFMEGNEKLVLGGGHGVRAYLPNILQRYSLDLDFYSNTEDIVVMKERLENMGFTYKGYGILEEGRFKRIDAPLPIGLKRATIALSRTYRQSFKIASVPPEFYVTVDNLRRIDATVKRRPRSYIPIEYVKEDIPVLPAETIIASKIAIIQIRPTKDLYKDLFDIHALCNKSDYPVTDGKIAEHLRAFSPKIPDRAIHERIKGASDESEARRAVKLPKEGWQLLGGWKETTQSLRWKIVALLKEANCLM